MHVRLHGAPKLPIVGQLGVVHCLDEAGFEYDSTVGYNDAVGYRAGTSQVFRPRDEGELIFDPGYNGVDRRSLILIQVLMVHMYPVDLKRELYRHIVTRLDAIGIRPQDIQIAVSENGYEDWYAGRLHGE